LPRRIRGLLAGLLAIVVSAGWWVALVELWPASDRPFIGGSSTNSILELTFGYNGLSRITGGSAGPGGGGGGSGGNSIAFGGSSGLGRLFGDSMGTQVSWLLPAALIALAAGLWLTRRAPRTDRTRAAIILWGTWLLVTGAIFSYMSGIVHPYYTVALAPAIGALIAIGGRALWQVRDTIVARLALAAGVLSSGVWGYVLLDRTPTWHPSLRIAVVAAAGIAAALLLLGPLVTRRRPLIAALALAGAIAMLGAPAAFALQTASTPHTGAIPTAGPSSGGGGFGGRGAQGAPPSGFGGQQGGTPPSGVTGGTPARGPRGGGGDTTSTSSALVTLLKSDTTHRWVAATVGSQSAAPIELATGRSVIAIGGFSGGDPAPTLAQFKALVANGEVHYYLAGGSGGPGGDTGSASAIASWVSSHFSSQTVGGQTIYDLTKAAS
jgi:4-amino-4-deoxy-L-arabinose transferase-like glycosyltransferase